VACNSSQYHLPPKHLSTTCDARISTDSERSEEISNQRLVTSRGFGRVPLACEGSQMRVSFDKEHLGISVLGLRRKHTRFSENEEKRGEDENLEVDASHMSATKSVLRDPSARTQRSLIRPRFASSSSDDSCFSPPPHPPPNEFWRLLIWRHHPWSRPPNPPFHRIQPDATLIASRTLPG